jgi:excisionase family DNA binding protein
MYESLGQAAKACGVSKSTILRAIKSHRISAVRSERTNDWTIDPAELHRVFPPAPAGGNDGERDGNGAVTHGATAAEQAATAVLEAQIAGLRDTAELLRAQLDDVRTDRDHWRDVAGRLAITDQRPQRSWWPWRKAG